jgi:hypothetical protein
VNPNRPDVPSMNPYREDPHRPTDRDHELWERSLRRLFCPNCPDAEMAKGWEYPRCQRGLPPQACDRAWWLAYAMPLRKHPWEENK